MSGITDLDRLLAEMEPQLREGTFVFCTVPPEQAEPLLHLKPVGTFREAEGLTLILPEEAAAENGMERSAPMRMITLAVHSSLEAVGLTATVAGALTRAGISANVVAAYHHDHIFVPAADADRALQTLKAVSRNGCGA
ncbi:ACT domain-containing protein [Mycoplana dimorpha]|uniref:DUF2241 domain-containing protein n=1 Tax=Mycoplana dimorpha TaxID=28320 RepID=A0A2T5AZG2_MYCDI|nr:ACT domain-containing protein [Mycoplana dimorpha]PTM92133.1 hypothetical protein C7449_108182 [Mycoplana dimorpha]